MPCRIFFEIGKYLSLRQNEPPIANFVSSMGDDDANGYRTVLDVYALRESTLATIRDNSAFHYGPIEIKSKNPLIGRALRAVADEPGVISVSQESVHFGFAGEVAAAIFTIACGGTTPDSAEVEAIISEVAGAVMHFNQFADAAVRRFLNQAGVSLEFVATT